MTHTSSVESREGASRFKYDYVEIKMFSPINFLVHQMYGMTWVITDKNFLERFSGIFRIEGFMGLLSRIKCA